MLIEYSKTEYLVLEAGEPIKEGRFVTVKDDKAFHLSPGSRIKGISGDDSMSNLCNIFGGTNRVTVYFAGELGTTRFDAAQAYSPLDPLYVNQAGMLTNRKKAGCSDKVGHAVGKEEAMGQEILRFWLQELPFLPKAPPLSVSRWEMMADQEEENDG